MPGIPNRGVLHSRLTPSLNPNPMVPSQRSTAQPSPSSKLAPSQRWGGPLVTVTKPHASFFCSLPPALPLQTLTTYRRTGHLLYQGSSSWRMTPVLPTPMKMDTKHELLSARAQQNILIWNPSWIIPVGLPQDELPCPQYTVEGDVAFWFQGVQVAEKDVGSNIVNIAIHLTLVLGGA